MHDRQILIDFHVKPDKGQEARVMSVGMWAVAQPGFLQGEPKFFEQHSASAVVKLSGSSHNGNIDVFLPRR